MSYYSVHMNHPVAGGYRRSEIQPTTVAELKRLSWRILRRPDVFLNGNTKWQEMPVVAFFFRNGFIDKYASDDIGFAPTSTGHGNGIGERLDKVNTQELLSFGIKLQMSGLLKKNWAWLLNPTRKPVRGRFSKHRIIFSKAICEQAMKKYGLVSVSWKLRVNIKIIRFWLDYEI